MQKIYDYFLYRYGDKDLTIFSKAKLVMNFCLVSSLFSFFYWGIASIISFETGMFFLPILAVFFLALVFLLRVNIPFCYISTLYLAMTYATAVAMVLKSSLVTSSMAPWFSFLPLSALLLINKKNAIVWLIISMVTVFGFAYIQDSALPDPVNSGESLELYIKATVLNGLSTIILIISLIFYKANERVLSALNEKNEVILSINEELKKRNENIISHNKELKDQKDEISAQREFIKSRNNELLIAQKEFNDLIEKLTITQQTLLDREAENSSILEALYKTELLVAEVALNGNFIKVSRSTVDYFQMTEQEFLGKNLSDICGTLSQLSHEHHKVKEFWGALRNGKSLSHATSLNIKGQEYWLKENFFPIKDKHGETEKIMIISQDITTIKIQQNEIELLNNDLKNHIMKIEKQNDMLLIQQKEIESINQELKQSNIEINYVNQNLEKLVVERTKYISQKNEQLSEYAYINAHLLRAPLCSILGLIGLIEKNPSHLEPHVLLHLKKSSRELKNVVDKISRAIESGTEFNREHVS